MAWATPTVPNLVDYQTWLYSFIGPTSGLNANILPPSSQVISDSLATAQAIVTDALGVANCDPNTTSLTIYVQAVYFLATDRLYNWAADVQGQTYFKDFRKEVGLFGISVGVSSQVSDQGTAVGVLNPEQMRLLTLQDLQTLKTPWGRQYMAYAQMYGRSLWGLT